MTQQRNAPAAPLIQWAEKRDMIDKHHCRGKCRDENITPKRGKRQKRSDGWSFLLFPAAAGALWGASPRCNIHLFRVTAPMLFMVEAWYFMKGYPMAIRIAYFSWKGHTQKVATALAERVNAELVRIEPSGTFNIAIGGMKAFLSMKSPIKECKTNLAGIDILVIASPVWSGKVPPFVNEYCSEVTGGSEKPFYVFTEMGSRGAEGAIAAVRTQLEKKGMRFVSSASTVEQDVDSGAFMTTVGKFAAGMVKK